ncbi:hypothetical protein [Emticicia sp. 17c]|uniref:hypothetical protein n=1 Tax=Emticicia sp. 17c TaxID=3127704 RepID=UPI00301BAC24
MKQFVNEISTFIRNNSNTTFLYNFDAFPPSPFPYIYLADKQTIIHCVTIGSIIEDGSFFQNLTLTFARMNLKIIHLWEDLWYTRRAIIESRLLSVLGKSVTIPARLTQSRRIDKPTLDAFLKENHLQIPTTAKFKYGLFLPERYFRVLPAEGNIFTDSVIHNAHSTSEILMAVASFSNAKTFVREGVQFRSFELIRFANLKGFTVVGGFHKLLQAFIREHKPDDIMTYADVDWSDGSSYEKLGFERVALTQPQSFMLDATHERIWKGTEPTERNEKVWNAGSWKYLLKLKPETNAT